MSAAMKPDAATLARHLDAVDHTMRVMLDMRPSPTEKAHMILTIAVWRDTGVLSREMADVLLAEFNLW